MDQDYAVSGSTSSKSHRLNDKKRLAHSAKNAWDMSLKRATQPLSLLRSLTCMHPPGASWARATNNVKKPQIQMCESCKKLDLRFVKQNRNNFGFSNTFDSEVCYCTK